MADMLVYDRWTVQACLCGILMSTYALHVEMSMEANPKYKALCDIGEFASCTRVLSSEYSRGFGLIDALENIPNCMLGILFFSFIIFLTTFEQVTMVRIQMFLTLAGVASSIYLAYLLAFVLKDICVVCITTYIINFTLAYLTYKKMKLFRNGLSSGHEELAKKVQ